MDLRYHVDVDGVGAEPRAMTLGPAPEVFLPPQFDDARRSLASTRPEERLMVAVLEDAIRCYQSGVDGGGKRRRQILHETEEWLASEDTSYCFSFVNVSAALGLDPDWIRAGLRRWRLRHAEARGARLATPPFHSPGVAGPRPASCDEPAGLRAGA